MNLDIALPIVGVCLSVLIAIYTRRTAKVEERGDARTEAMELAEVRGKMIDDLDERIKKLEHDQEREREEHQRKIVVLEQVIEHVRAEAAEAQRMLVVGFRGVVVKLLGHLEAEPAEVDQAVEFLRDVLNDGPGGLPDRRRRAA